MAYLNKINILLVSLLWFIIYFIKIFTLNDNLLGSSTMQNTKDTVDFIILGDHGSGDEIQKAVAKGIDRYLRRESLSVDFFISTGDIIYEEGLTDHKGKNRKELRDKFENVYTTENFQKPWLMTLGNHDCYGSVDALLEYAQDPSTIWHFPSRYYYYDHPIDENTIVRIISLDSCDLEWSCDFYNKIKDKKLQKRIIRSKIEKRKIMLEEMDEGEMHKTEINDTLNNLFEYIPRYDQLKWLESILKDSNNISKKNKRVWKLVVGHWSVYSYARHGSSPKMQKYIKPLLLKYKVHAFISGHDHLLQHIYNSTEDIDKNWRPHYIVSGGGGASAHEIHFGDDIGKKRSNIEMPSNLMYYHNSHGFMSAKFHNASAHSSIKTNNTADQLQITFHDMNGKKLYSFFIKYTGGTMVESMKWNYIIKNDSEQESVEDLPKLKRTVVNNQGTKHMKSILKHNKKLSKNRKKYKYYSAITNC